MAAMDSHLTIAPNNVAMLRLASAIDFSDKSKSLLLIKIF
jgi:hypothetical protein